MIFLIKMSITPYNSIDDIFGLTLDGLHKDLFYHYPWHHKYYLSPAKPDMKLDMIENDDNWVLVADLPGVSKDEINVEIENGMLTISAEKKKVKTDAKLHRQERMYGMVSRSISLPQDASEDINAKYNEGVLTITLNKTTEEDKKRKKIAIM
jgi:HSP20 family protein